MQKHNVCPHLPARHLGDEGGSAQLVDQLIQGVRRQVMAQVLNLRQQVLLHDDGSLYAARIRRHTPHPVDRILPPQYQVGKGVRLLLLLGFGLAAFAFVLAAAAPAPLLPGVLQVRLGVAAEGVEVGFARLRLFEFLVLRVKVRWRGLKSR